METVLKTLGLTHPQFVVLATAGWLIRNGDPVTQVTIGKLAGLDPNTNSQIIKGLEQKELIKRGQSSDGRAKNVSLTQKGSKIVSQALPAVEHTDAAFFSILTKKEIRFLVEIFQKLVSEQLSD
ncbi:MAG: MarR family winged helix-turn-helix transcriptional regulator [Rhabdochlamydiaceae bacterium]